MISLNRAMIVGNLTRDPELRTTPAGQSVCSFGIATNRRWKGQDGEFKEDTQFHDIVAWGKLAEIVSTILKKGNRVYVDGRLQTRQWEGQDGVKRQRTEIVMENFIPLTPKGASTESMAKSELSPESPVSTETADTETDGKKGKSKDKKDKKKSDDEEIDLDEIPF